MGVRVRELRVRAGRQVPVFGISQVRVWEVPQHKAGPSVLVSFPQDQHLILGAEEGIFILNRNDQEATLEMVKDSSQGGLRAGAGAGDG